MPGTVEIVPGTAKFSGHGQGASTPCSSPDAVQPVPGTATF
ncbi:MULTISPECIES: hypothetical protein [Amycolatopsis]|uniref:Uncharacterized protein n=1 Tax=Amycolatopsis albidoflavus TaxID=102226 RepID=A0ABW5ID68_9PSEU